MNDKKPLLKIILASPRGFCAGVTRAVLTVEKTIEKYGAPIYVRHEIVHNRIVVDFLKRQGAVFVDELDEVPNDRPVIFSAHGVPQSVVAEAERRNLKFIDATCPLVGKVHQETRRYYEKGYKVILIGHDSHPEVIGTKGQIPPDAIVVIENLKQAQAFVP